MPAVKKNMENKELAGELRHATMRLYRNLRRQSATDLSPQMLSALATIAIEGPITLGDLAVAEVISPPSVTKVAGKLEEFGLVTRDTDAADGRIQRLRISPTGKKTLDKSRAQKTAWLATQLETLSAGERATLEKAIPVLQHLLETSKTKVAP